MLSNANSTVFPFSTSVPFDQIEIGKIERLWNGRTEGVPFAEPTIDKLVANPEGNEFNMLSTLINSVIAGLAT